MKEIIAAMQIEIEALKSTLANMAKVGTVHAVDGAKGYRLALGEGPDGPVLSPWYPHPESGKSSVPLKVGQIVGVINPTGDPRQGFVLRGGYSDGHPAPNADMAANVFADAGVRIEIKDGGLILTADEDVTLTIGGKIRLVAERFEVN